MKYCPGCKLNVGGEFDNCPLCQNELQGDGEPNVFPFSVKLNKQSFVYKLQLFIAAAIIIVCAALDFLCDIRVEKHWSVLVVIWVVVFEICVRGLIKRHPTLSRVTSYSAVGITVCLAYIFWFVGRLEVFTGYVMPAICLTTLALHFIFSLTDKARNALVYFLVNILVAIIPNMVWMAQRTKVPLLWTVNLMVAAVTFTGLMIFKGTRVVTEIQKRLNF